MLRDVPRAVWIVAAVVFFAHVLVVAFGPYEYFRDELYFIACGRRPSFGYVDQPPLVPLLAAGTQVFGACLTLLRALPAAAHALTCVVAARLAAIVADEAEVDARVASVATALGVALTPMFLGLHATLNTTSFEPLAWTLVAWLAARAALFGETKRLVTCGAVIGVALEAKYAIPFFVAPLAVGLALSRERKVLFTRDAGVGALVAIVLAAPSFVWQAMHGFPFLELMHAASHGKNVVIAPLAFLGNQVGVMNPVLAPMWIGGVAWALASKRLARARFLAIAFVLVLVVMIALHGKDYYAAPAYPTAFALGGAGIARVLRRAWGRTAYFAAVVVVAGIALPTCLPILAPPTLARYVVAMHLAEQTQENAQRGVEIPAMMADLHGWKELEARVAGVWRSLSDDERAHAVILVSNYGEGGAIDFYGRADGLPRAVSGHNQYWMWGPEMDAPRVVVRVNGSVERWGPRCESLVEAAKDDVPYVMPYEKDGPILVCRGMKMTLASLWPDFKSYE